MIISYMIYAALAAAVLADGLFECSFLNSTKTQCLGAVGHPLIFHLSNKTNVDITLFKDGRHKILNIDKKGSVTVYEGYANVSEAMYNGAYKICNASKTHAGDYELKEYGKDGKLLRSAYVHVKVQVPVSKPAVSQTCLPHERMEITCSSEGDEPEFVLTLDDQLFIKIRDHDQSRINCTAKECGVSNVSINLNGQLAGKIMCQVWNNASKDETVIYLSPCKGFDAVKVVAISSAATLFLLLTLTLIVIKLHKRSRPTPVNEGNCETEIIYTDVKVIKKTRQDGPNLDDNAT